MKGYVPLAQEKIEMDSDFEGGTLGRAIRLGENYYFLELRPDTYYHFHFRIRGCKGKEIIFQFACRDCIASLAYMNEGQERWVCPPVIVKPVVSYDRKNYVPVEYMDKDTSGVKGTFTFQHTFTEDEAYISAAHPYLYTDMMTYLETLKGVPGVTISSMGTSRNGVDQPLVTIRKNPQAEKAVLIISREDADEAVGSFAVEGMINHLLSGVPEAEDFLQRYVFIMAPMVSVDGVIAGSIHSAGYGYGGFRYKAEPVPRELANVKKMVRSVVADGLNLALVGKLHGGWSMEPVYPIDFNSADPEIIRALLENTTEYWNPKVRTDQLAIREEGFFERFIVDEFNFHSVFGCHIQGKTPDAARFCGRDLLKALFAFLRKKH